MINVVILHNNLYLLWALTCHIKANFLNTMFYTIIRGLIGMWLQLRLYLLVGLMFAILYGIIVGIGYLLGYSGFTFYVLIIGFALQGGKLRDVKRK